MFSVDHKAADDDIRPEGEYECIIENAQQSVTRSGTHCIEVCMKVRSDVENPRGGKIFYNIWKAKNPSKADTACEGYLSSWVQKLSKASGLPNGKNYESIDEWCKDLAGHPVKAKVIHDEYKGKVNAKVDAVSETKFPLHPDFVPPSDDDDNEVPF